MKLLQKTVRWYMLFSLVAFIIGGLVLFVALRWIFTSHLDEGLKHTRHTLHEQLLELDTLPAQLRIMDEVVEVHPLATFSPYEHFTDTLIWHDLEQEEEPYRKYTFHDKLRGKAYRISLSHSQLENDDLATSIVIFVLSLFGLLLLAVNWFNRLLSAKIWQPFYQIIRDIQNFRVVTPSEKKLPIPTDIDEFALLDQTFEQMTAKILADYQSLKQFTENASHETQTPLAIIQSHIELLLQQDLSAKQQMQHLYSIQQAVSKLSKLQQSLLLLTRIENQQYQTVENIAIDQLLTKQLDILQPLLEAQSIQVITKLQAVNLTLHKDLADILLTNLLGNAIKHNLPEGGVIEIELNPVFLRIANTGLPLKVAPSVLLERFRKNDAAAKSIGLGLAIVKEITKYYNWELQYETVNQRHILTVLF